MGDLDLDNNSPKSQMGKRTVLDTILCVLIVASYVPQYVAIVRNGTLGISSRFVLYHFLFSTFTLVFHLAHFHFYDQFNRVHGGSHRGWKAYSSLLGFIQSIVQFLAALILLVLFLGYRTTSQPNESTEHPEPDLPSSIIWPVAISVPMAVLPVSLAFLWFNKAKRFDDLSNFIAVYCIGLGVWHMILASANIVMLVLQFVYGIETVKALQSRGALSAVSLLMQAVVLMMLGVSQALRSGLGPPLTLALPSSSAHFLEWFQQFYGIVHTYVMYFACGIGFWAVFILCWRNQGFGSYGALRL